MIIVMKKKKKRRKRKNQKINKNKTKVQVKVKVKMNLSKFKKCRAKLVSKKSQIQNNQRIENQQILIRNQQKYY